MQWGIIVAAAACSLVAAVRQRLSGDDWDLVFWLGVVAFALFMTTAASMPVWRATPQLSYLQFPWRFLMLIAVAGGCLAANLAARLRSAQVRALAVTVAVGLHMVLSGEQRRPAHYLPRQAMDIDRPRWSDTPEAQKNAFVEPGYFPADPRGRREMRHTDLRRWADASSAATGAVTVLLVATATPWRRRRGRQPAPA